MSLTVYHKKRNFKKTTEPKGKVTSKDKNLFVVQKHAASHLHYDFRLELNGVLLSWAIPKGPCLDPNIKRLAMHVEDHPVEYGSFEGMIPKGQYGAGTVMLWDRGKWLSLDDDPKAAYRKGHLRFVLKAKKLNGQWSLIKIGKDSKSWLLIKVNDEFARPLKKFDITKAEPNSALSQQTLDDITDYHTNIWTNDGIKKTKSKKKTIREPKEKLKISKINIPLMPSEMPQIIFPQLATRVDQPPIGDAWLHEIKFDGYRIIAFKEKDKVRLMSRNNREWTEYFKNVQQAVNELTIHRVILDGEIILLDKNHRSNFQLLQNSIDSNKAQHFLYYVFDILYYDKFNLMQLPLIERKQILRQLLPTHHATLHYSDHIIGSGKEVFKKTCELKLEGILSKKIDSHYEAKRSKTWLKSKCIERQEFVIGGYTKPQRSREYFGSLFLGYFDQNNHLIFCGNVGTGFNRHSLTQIYHLLQNKIINKNPFNHNPPGATSAIWVKPELVADIEFSEWTNDGLLRHPSFKGLRTDKVAKSIIREESMKIKNFVSPKKRKRADEIQLPIKLTNPNKILYPENKYTKMDIALYYADIHDWILPYIINRPLSILRCPDNYKECFYQKHTNKSTPNALYGLSINEHGKKEKYIYIKDYEGLMTLAQLGTLEIHPWGSQIDKVEYPDMITFDLDPAPDVSWKEVVFAAKQIRDYLAIYKLKSFVKTTGGKGLHVVVPIKPEYDWHQVKNFSHIFVRFLAHNHPSDYIITMSKKHRQGKIYADYLRNQRGATSISPYSTRAHQGAPVSVPLHWDELTNNKNDTTYTITTLPIRLQNLKKDPWKDFFKIKQSLKLDQILSE